MNTYRVTIEETVQSTIDVNASDQSDAEYRALDHVACDPDSTSRRVIDVRRLTADELRDEHNDGGEHDTV